MGFSERKWAEEFSEFQREREREVEEREMGNGDGIRRKGVRESKDG